MPREERNGAACERGRQFEQTTEHQSKTLAKDKMQKRRKIGAGVTPLLERFRNYIGLFFPIIREESDQPSPVFQAPSVRREKRQDCGGISCSCGYGT